MEEIVELWNHQSELFMALVTVEEGKANHWVRDSQTRHDDAPFDPDTDKGLRLRFVDANGRDIAFPVTLIAEARYKRRESP